MKHKTYFFQRIICLCLAMLLVMFSVLPTFADETSTSRSVIEINDVSDFLLFDSICKQQSRTQNLDVQLKNDIDLSGTGFTGLSSFSGNFYGNGHMISGVSIQDPGGVCGLFQYVEQGALICDLTVNGTIVTDDSSDTIGLIAGANAGEIRNCKAEGNVIGTGICGGLVGVNGANGVISNSVNRVQVSSISSVGGICGENHGIIRSCNNAGGINDKSDWLNYEDDTVLTLTVNGIFNYIQEKASVGSDIGGVCGYSDGTITGCVNRGIVGYQHAGKNVGGIAGRSCGQISSCSNTGDVFGKQDVGGIVGQMEPYIAAYGEDFEEASLELQQMTEQLEHDLTSIGQSAGNELVDLSNTLQNLQIDENVKDPEILKNDMEQYSDTLQHFSDQVNAAGERIPGDSAIIAKDLRNVQNKVADMNSLTQQKLDNLRRIGDGGDLIEDYSALDPTNENASRVCDCTNYGYVNADRNCGGISGSMGIDGSDAEDSTTSEGGNTYKTLAVIEKCKDKGILYIKKQNAGGIVGNASLGFVSNCEAQGRIYSDDATYVGGIAGYCEGTVSDCKSTAVLSGNGYIGGICGAAKNVRYCYAIPCICDATDRVGAILGSVISTRENDITLTHASTADTIYSNYFVSDTLYGMNGVNYAGLTNSVTYYEMKTLTENASIFTDFRAVFLDENYHTVGSLKVSYGQKISELNYPGLPNSNSEYTVWKGNYNDICYSNVFFIASAKNETSVLGSDLLEGEKPVLLMEGSFYDDTTLNVTVRSDNEVPNLNSDRAIRTYNIQVENSGLSDEDISAVRVLIPTIEGVAAEDLKVEVYQLTDSGWTLCSSEIVGSYAETTISGNKAYISVQAYSDTSISKRTIVIVCVGIAAVLVLISVVLKKKIQKKKR